jgi:hypothetical protein
VPLLEDPQLSQVYVHRPSHTYADKQTLPQNHIFNPLLPPTPKMPRPPRRGESLLSINGSPLAPENSDSESGEDDTELPDPKAYEARLAKSQLSKSVSKPMAKGKGKRAPSSMIRQSLAPAHQEDEEEEQDGTRSITLSDGRCISYNPFMVDPAGMEAEMRECGLKEEDIERVSKQIRAEALQALTERMGIWKM